MKRISIELSPVSTMGHVPLSDSQQLLNTGSTWTFYSMSQTYDLAGHVLSKTHPSGRVANYTYNAGGRTSGFTGNLSDGTSRTYTDTISYNPAGQLTQGNRAINILYSNNLCQVHE